METTTQAPQVAESPSPRSIDLATLAWLRLARIYHKIDRRTADRMRQHGITVGRFDVLNHAGTPEGRTQQELAASLLVTKGNITQLLDAMEAEGLLERRREGRCNRIFLTPAGRARRETLVALQDQALATEFAVLTRDEQTELHRLLRKLDRALDAGEE